MVETDKLTTQQIELANKIFSALAGKFKSVWIVLARCYLDEKLCTKNGHIQVQEWFPDFYVPKMTYPLRGTSPIVKFVKKNNEEMLKVLKFLNNLSIFLLKVRQSRKQIIVSSILLKNARWDNFQYTKLSQRSFFGRIEDTINCFRDLLTFR